MANTLPERFLRSFRWPVLASASCALLHLPIGRRLGFPSFVHEDPIFWPLGSGLAAAAASYPLVTIVLVAFNIAVVIQEFRSRCFRSTPTWTRMPSRFPVEPDSEIATKTAATLCMLESP